MGNENPKNVNQFPFKIIKENGITKFQLKNNDKIRPEKVSAEVLRYLKKCAMEFLGCKDNELAAVVTVPAYFNDSQRSATKAAGEIAGLKILRIVNEPTAAAIAYGLDKKDNKKNTIAVFDLGGGTFDISILEIEDGTFEVQSTNGDSNLGGDDFDARIVSYILAETRKEKGIDLSKDGSAISRITSAAKSAKIALSTQNSTDINIPFISVDAGNPVHIALSLSRAKFEQLIHDDLQKVIKPCKEALADAKISTSEINEVILVGGSTRIPKVIQLVEEIFKKKPNKNINPDEAVAMGAAIQGGVLAGKVSDVLLLDVTPLSLGLETQGGVLTKLIEKNTTIPTKKSQIFSTAADNQTAVTIKVYQGERPMAIDNKLLGSFNLEGIPAAPRGTPQIEVTFDIDANGILNVSAMEKNTGKKQSVTIKDSGGLSKEEIEKMKREAEENAEADLKKKELIEEKNKAESSVFQAETTLKKREDLNEEQKEPVKSAIETLKKSIEEENIESMKKDTEELMKLVYGLPPAPKTEEPKKETEEAKTKNNDSENKS